jgi:hypothetical protein
MKIQLRKTTTHDIEWIIAAEQHPDNCAYVYQWDAYLHESALNNPELRHLVIEDNWLF